jgi:DNA-binding NtrC family response regulator
MIRIHLHTADPKLHPLLASALEPECSIQLHPAERKLTARSIEHADVLLLDFDSNNNSLTQQLELYDEIGEVPVPVIVMTDDLRRSSTTEFLLRGAFDCIRKPPSILELKVVIRRAHEHCLMKTELAAMRQTSAATQPCDQLIGSSGRAQVLYDLIRRVANLSASVLIIGESGTGKELVARAIHNLGHRSDLPFVAVSCGAIPESLIEAELFGHEKGAYTGSLGARAGYLEQAAGGTLFLDEIGELSLNTQVKLLRVLQQREFCRLGGNKVVQLNARVLFATHRNLNQMVDEGTFRRDLFFRVNVVTVPVPALRDRPADIPVLAMHFVKRYAAEYEKPVTEIRPNAMEALLEYDWPGNIRELENVIQGAVILADGESITRVHLPEHLRRLSEECSLSPQVDSGCFEDLLRQFKLTLAVRAISECNGNKSLAARKLGVSRAYLHRLIRITPISESTDVA